MIGVYFKPDMLNEKDFNIFLKKEEVEELKNKKLEGIIMKYNDYENKYRMIIDVEYGNLRTYNHLIIKEKENNYKFTQGRIIIYIL